MDIISIAYFAIFGILFLSMVIFIVVIAYFFWERKRFKKLSKQERKVLGFIIKEKSTTLKRIQINFKMPAEKISKILLNIKNKGLIKIKRNTITHKKLNIRKTKNI